MIKGLNSRAQESFMKTSNTTPHRIFEQICILSGYFWYEIASNCRGFTLYLSRMNYELAIDYGISEHALAVLRIPGSIGMESFSLNFAIALKSETLIQ